MARISAGRLHGRVVSRLGGLILIGIGLAIAILGGLLLWNNMQTRIALEQAEADAQVQAANLERQIERIGDALTSEPFRTAAARSDADRNSLVRALRASEVTNVVNVVVARESVESVDLSAFPGSGFAALEMLLQARAEGDVPVQVHFAGTPDEYLAVASRLVPDDPASAVALATFPISVLANRVETPASIDGMRLVQVDGGEVTVLEEFGGSAGAGRGLPIDGSLLRLDWSRGVGITPLSGGQVIGVVGVGLLTLVLGVLVARRARRRAAVPVEDEIPEAVPEAPESEPAGSRTEVLDSETLAEISGTEAASPAADAPPSERPEAQTGVEAETDSAEPAGDELEFDPDAPPDESGEISQMLRSLVEEEEDRPAATEDEDEASAERPESEKEDSVPPESTEIAVPPATIFRAYDIRGVVGDTLSAEYAESIGRAIGSEAQAHGLTRIAVARDGRLSGAELLDALSRGLMATGMHVVDVGAVPTPVLYYAAQEIAGGSGVMVTGSHNPPDYNGFKIVLGGETLSGERITALHERLEAGELEHGDGEISEQRIAVKYIERIGTDIQLEKPLKVVADCGNGIAGAIAPRLLEAIGAEVIPLYAEVDGTFPNHHPDPGDPATLEDLKLCVRNFNADVGVAFDGDGDRLGVVAPDGEIIYPDRLMMLFARDVLSRNPGQPIIFDVKCSSLLPEEIEDAGGKPVMARTGHSFIKAQLKREQAPLAGEMSGHFFFAERWFGFDDGMYAAARLLEILAADTRASGQILGSLPNAVSTPELKVEMKEGETHPFVESFKDAADFPDAEVNDIDGVRADFPDGFGLVRASNTTPVLVVRFEGKDKEALARIQQKFREAMLSVNPALKLPF
jgi:phosphomannomutase